MENFKDLGLSNEFVAVLEKDNITKPSEIQAKAIPLILQGKDVIGGSATGSGKTIAFSSGIIEKLEKNGSVQALILTPTRELAEQVTNVLTKLSKHKKLNVLSIYGGVSIDNQIRKLQNTDIVVGTPGRVLDHLTRGTLKLNKVKFLVLDEVDRMFDMGFQFDVEKIISQVPKERQTMLFSATITPSMDRLARKHTKNPKEIAVKSHVDNTQLKQVYYDVPDGLKFSLFAHLLKKEKSNLVMVFCGTRRNVDFVVKNLKNLGIHAKAIHGGLNQNKRNKVMEEFNSEKGVNVLVCTDVAARGLDIEGVTHVYNYDLPKTSEEYIHRIGRTARAGKDGIAISILCSRDYENFSNIERDEKLSIERAETSYVDKVRIITDVSRKRGRGNFRGNKRNFGNKGNNGRRNNSRGKRKFGKRDNNDKENNFRGNKRTFGKRNDSRKNSSKRNFRKRNN